MGKVFDKVFANGRFMRNNEQKKIDFVAVKNGKIVKCGRAEEMNDYKTDYEIIDLKGKFVYPGFTDAHMHLIAYSQKKLYEVALNDVYSREELVKKVKTFIKKKNIKPGDWVIGAGWNQDQFEDNVFPDRYLLDEISTQHPIHLTRTCYHICVVNSKALDLAGIDENTISPDGGKIDQDKDHIPTGILRENAMDLVTRILPGIKDKNRMKELIIKGCEDLAKVGITTVHTDDFPFVEDKETLWKVFKELANNNELPIRVVLQLRAAKEDDIYHYERMGLKSFDKINNLVVGPIKVITDGSLGSRTAALEEPYEDDKENKGLMLMSEEKLDQLVHESFYHDFDICMHAIGDRSMRAILASYERYYDLYREKGFRPSIIHCQIGNSEILNGFKKLNIIANIQPIFSNTDWKIAESRIGKERLKYSYCWKTYMDMGIVCVGSSDAPIESFNPLYGIYTAVTRKDLEGNPKNGWVPEESLDIHRAVDLFIKNASYLSHEEEEKGSIEVGKYADFVVLAEDLLKVDEEHIKDILVENTIVGGKIL
ncbi:amidohydrolase [Crassaminicella profunda]|uniref:amidohydrolase n=1 Tax=Crassaminicella profunda TaxID=1286698 RepID=UPI001CA75D57|nr:amidohydrolase [Crassaminicella profunda]QZY55624.1 amidohydrolase [Crassaminicella profunda]